MTALDTSLRASPREIRSPQRSDLVQVRRGGGCVPGESTA
jgi:hypothetical protein